MLPVRPDGKISTPLIGEVQASGFTPQHPDREAEEVHLRFRNYRNRAGGLITRAVPKEGKTLVAVDLAATLARTSPRVCLIDADRRQPGVMRALGVPLLPGLAEFLEGRKNLTSGLRIVDPLGIHYLPAGHPTINPVELLQGQRMGELLTEVSARLTG